MSDNIGQVDNILKNKMTSDYADALLFGIDTNEGQLTHDDRSLLLLIYHHFGNDHFTRVDLQQACLGKIGLNRCTLHKWIKRLVNIGALKRVSFRQAEFGRNIVRYGYKIEVIE